MNPSSNPPQIIVTSDTRDFRSLAQQRITVNDFFLEIGCSYGGCTKLLGDLGFRGIALDHSAEAVTRTRRVIEEYPGISVVQADARDTVLVHTLCPDPSVILLDIGGRETLDKVTALLRLLLKTFHPGLILVKSIELAELSSIIRSYHIPKEPSLLAHFEDDGIPHQLMELSRSPVINDRLFALRRLRRFRRQEEVLKRIEEMQTDASPKVRKLAMRILGKKAVYTT